jgi:acetylglutamate kinase
MTQALFAALHRTRVDARPWLIKLGGSVLDHPVALSALTADVVALAHLGVRPIIVHGGGKAIDRATTLAGLPVQKVQGRRFTDPATLAIVVRTLTDDMNPAVVRGVRAAGGRAVGLCSGADEVLHGERLLLPGLDLQPIDLGRVGNVTRVGADVITSYAHAGIIPVIPSLARDVDGGWLNVNADTAAAAVAEAVHAQTVVFLSDTPGVLLDPADAGSRLPHLNSRSAEDLINRGVIAGGMVPKIEACFACLKLGIPQTVLLDGREPHALLDLWLGQAVPGTVVTEV